METKVLYSPKLASLEIGDEGKYISGLSTFLVATIQEAKDRISQIEYIFCTQLYPNFQLKSNNLQKICAEAKKDMEDECKKREKDLLLHVENLEVEKQQLLEKNKCLMIEKEKELGEVNKERNALLPKVKGQLDTIERMEKKLAEKDKEVKEMIDWQAETVSSMESRIVVLEGQLTEQEKKNCQLLDKVKTLEEMRLVVQKELQDKTETAEQRSDLIENLEDRIWCLELKLAESEEQQIELENQKKELMYNLKYMEETVSEHKEKLQRKTEELDKERAQLLKQIDLNGNHIVKQQEKLNKVEGDKKLLLDQVNELEKNVNELKENLADRCKVADERYSDMQAEKKKYKALLEAYKRLKSQFNYICRKFGLTEENMINPSTSGNESHELKLKRDSTPSPDFEDKNIDASVYVVEADEMKIKNEYSEKLEVDKVVKSIPAGSFNSPTSDYVASKRPPTVKSAPQIGMKRPAESWIDTRSHQCKNGADPHDDFLDTPLENVKANLNKAMKEEVHVLHAPAEKEIIPDSSDDETQDLKGPTREKDMVSVPVDGKKSFKFVEPVRKKTDRENLKGVECKQCKKFYHAILPDGGKDTRGNQQQLRCEHHEGISRHRYKYIPPMTPEGFWNIGFDSEM